MMLFSFAGVREVAAIVMDLRFCNSDEREKARSTRPSHFFSRHECSEAGEASIPTAVLKQLPVATILSVFTYKIEEITSGKDAIDRKPFSAGMDPVSCAGDE